MKGGPRVSCSTAASTLEETKFASTLEATKFQVDWEREIVDLDRKELELHQSQMRLIREQMSGFVREVASLREVVNCLTPQHSGSGSFSLQEERREPSEDLSGVVADLRSSVANNSQELRRITEAVAGLEDRQGNDRVALGEHVWRLEQMLKESAERQQVDCADVRQLHESFAVEFTRHAREVEELLQDDAKLQPLHDRLAACEGRAMQVGSLQQAQGGLAERSSELDATQAALSERVALLEQQLGEAAERHSRELFAVRVESRGATPTRAGGEAADSGMRMLGAKLDAAEERLACAEQTLESLADRHDEELASIQRAQDLSQMRLLTCEKHGTALTELRLAQSSLTGDKAQLEILCHSLQERVDGMEETLSGSAGSSTQRLEAAHDRLEELQGRLARFEERHGPAVLELRRSHAELADNASAFGHEQSALGERLDNIEALFGDATNRQTKELSTVRAANEKHAATLAKHTTHLDTLAVKLEGGEALPERIEYIQQQLGESVELQTMEVAELHKRLTQEHSARERSHAALSDLVQREQAHVGERLGTVESALGDATERHSRELASVASEQRHLAGEVRSQSDVGELLDNVRRSVSEAAEAHAQDISAMQAKVDSVYARFSKLKQAWTHDDSASQPLEAGSQPCSP